MDKKAAATLFLSTVDTTSGDVVCFTSSSHLSYPLESACEGGEFFCCRDGMDWQDVWIQRGCGRLAGQGARASRRREGRGGKRRRIVETV